MDHLDPGISSSIYGVVLQPLAEIPARGGPVLHMLRSDRPWFTGFGEIYFSLAEPGAVKGWKRHRRQTQNFAVPSGAIEVALYDDRPGSPTKGQVAAILLGRPDNYRLLQIPPGIWYAFACRSPHTAVLANCADLPHDPTESDTLSLDSPEIPFSLEGSLFLAEGRTGTGPDGWDLP